ncbi:MAG: MaoC/PaaZ C-terminal domain-containing protein [Archaeoglobaceae archaeon]|nr:MaoC/PaaZ C-terminal domain-containing protein [Archaeoglobaceae archaeon]MCX8152798.1 MaoC/PaaZ C-terminal domain-containing protein [Archaeoglobaceae archaeon]MDW8013505.1 MaoC/PaaZ C-terminal domain-containing protein [Archaeoglobaceae archaeon]
MKFFEDFELGEKFESPARTITEADIVMFAALSGDWTPIHVDEEYAKSTAFGRRIAHGLLTLSIASGLLTRLRIVENTVVAFYGIDKLRFTKPVFAGDTIKAVAEVISKEDKDQYGVIVYDVKVYKQTGELVLTYVSKVAVKKRPFRKDI